MPTPLKPFKWYKKLATKKGRLEAGVFIVEGTRSINHIISNHPDEIIEILTIDEPLSIYNNYVVRVISENQCQYICQTKTPQGIMAIVKIPRDIWSDTLPDDSGDKILLLEDVQDPGNVGTLIRTATAFDYAGAILSENCADPLMPKCVQASMGAVLSIWLRRTANYIELIKILKQDGYAIAATDLSGTDDPALLSHNSKLLLALGNEGAGISKAMLNIADCRVKIPTIKEKAESLNVAACGAICMYLSSQNS